MSPDQEPFWKTGRHPVTGFISLSMWEKQYNIKNYEKIKTKNNNHK